MRIKTTVRTFQAINKRYLRQDIAKKEKPPERN